ncbi:MAG: sulfotransferase family 2 domain-containing protein [Acidiphilium sp.]|nr:sulfotransferase family 2 domain-containing protein [Acidiphilium sp.]MDD4936582.1 sulfotransferase family 2 domain-containing protein [Acidiphilium sp.]
MIVSHQHQFVFIHNPKCAGSSFRSQIGHLHDDPTSFWDIQTNEHLGLPQDFAHLRLWELQAFHGDLFARIAHYRSVVFVRNPFRRLVSSLSEHIARFRPEFAFETLDQAGQREVIDGILGELSAERLVADFRYVHFSPQHWFISLPGQPPAWTVVPISDAPDSILPGFDALGLPRGASDITNQTAYSCRHLLSYPRLLLFTLDFYAADFALFRALGLPDRFAALPVGHELALA